MIRQVGPTVAGAECGRVVCNTRVPGRQGMNKSEAFVCQLHSDICDRYRHGDGSGFAHRRNPACKPERHLHRPGHALYFLCEWHLAPCNRIAPDGQGRISKYRPVIVASIACAIFANSKPLTDGAPHMFSVQSAADL